MTTSPSVLVMAKVPRPGLVKTRLAPLLGDDACVRLQSALVRRAAALAVEVAPDATYVAFHPPCGRAGISCLVPPGAVLLAQRGEHLGERLAAAVTEVFAARSGPLVVIGTDIPLMLPRHLREALTGLSAGRDAVLGPACDGGYYLLAMARPLAVLFALDAWMWGGPQVLAATLVRARAAGLSVGLLEPLRDLDTAADAAVLLADTDLPGELRSLLGSTTVPSFGRQP